MKLLPLVLWHYFLSQPTGCPTFVGTAQHLNPSSHVPHRWAMSHITAITNYMPNYCRTDAFVKSGFYPRLKFIITGMCLMSIKRSHMGHCKLTSVQFHQVTCMQNKAEHMLETPSKRDKCCFNKTKRQFLTGGTCRRDVLTKVYEKNLWILHVAVQPEGTQSMSLIYLTRKTCSKINLRVTELYKSSMLLNHPKGKIQIYWAERFFWRNRFIF